MTSLFPSSSRRGPADLLAACLLAGSLLGGCMLTGPGTIGSVEDLDKARSLWRAQQLDSYDMELVRGCFCIGAGTMTVFVREDTVAAVHQTDRSWNGFNDWWQYIPTVDDLFDLIESAETEADALEVSYSESQGYPTTVSIDWIEQAVDDEISYSVLSVDPVSGSDVIRLSVGDSATVDDLSLTFEGVEEDSRCPQTVSCVWAGQARIRLSVAEADPQNAESMVLVDGELLEGDASSLELDGHRITLLGVLPYPQDDTPIDSQDYTVLLLIETL